MNLLRTFSFSRDSYFNNLMCLIITSDNLTHTKQELRICTNKQIKQ